MFKYCSFLQNIIDNISHWLIQLRKTPVRPIYQLMFGQLGGCEVVLQECLAVVGVHGKPLLLPGGVPLHAVQVLQIGNMNIIQM